MVRLRRFVLPVRHADAQQAVVLDVVGRGELPTGDEVVHGQEGDHHRPEGDQQAELKHRRHRIRLQHGVAWAPGAEAERAQPLRLELPGAADAAGQLAQREAVDALAHACAGMVFWRGHPAVVAAAMLHREVAIGRHREDQPRQPLLGGVVLVTEFMAGGQAHAGVGTGDVGEHRQRPPGQRLRAGPPCTADQRHEVQRHGGPGQPAVVAVGLELRHDGLGWVVEVLADQRVEQGHQHIAGDQRQRQRDRLAGPRMQRHAEQRHQRVDHRQQPAQALAVAPGDGLPVGAGAAVRGREQAHRDQRIERQFRARSF